MKCWYLRIYEPKQFFKMIPKKGALTRNVDIYGDMYKKLFFQNISKTVVVVNMKILSDTHGQKTIFKSGLKKRSFFDKWIFPICGHKQLFQNDFKIT